MATLFLSARPVRAATPSNDTTRRPEMAFLSARPVRAATWFSGIGDAFGEVSIRATRAGRDTASRSSGACAATFLSARPVRAATPRSGPDR